jgi:hypothetical protein
MTIFKNKILAEIDEAVPALPVKIKQVMLFALIDGFVSGGCEHEDEFINDLKILLGVVE